MFGPPPTEQNQSFVFPPVLRLPRFLIKLSVGNASVTPETQSVLVTTYAFRVRTGLQKTNFPSVVVKPWRSHKSTQGLMYTLMSRELNLTKRLHLLDLFLLTYYYYYYYHHHHHHHHFKAQECCMAGVLFPLR